MDENKTMSFAVLGVVAVLAVVSVVLLLTDASQTAQVVIPGVSKVYTNFDQDPAPYSHGLVNGVAGTDMSLVGESQVPYRDNPRADWNVPSWQTSCRSDEEEVQGLSRARAFESRYDTRCRSSNGGQDGRWCCPRVNRASGQLVE